jgi:Spy/CpxP family protein refolding chaperone
MFKHRLIAISLVGLLYAAPAVVAQNNATDPQAPAAGAPADRGPGHRHMDPQRRSQMLGRKLNLSSDQQAKVQDILQSAHSDMERVRSDSLPARQEERMERRHGHDHPPAGAPATPEQK